MISGKIKIIGISCRKPEDWENITTKLEKEAI